MKPACHPQTDTAPDDETLIVRIAAGDEGAFRDFAERYAGLVFSLSYRMGFHGAAAEDITQETWLRIWQHAGRWNKKGGASVKTWLCRIVGNLCIDASRKRRWQAEGEMPEIADTAPGAEGTLESRETGALVGRALEALPARQRAALVMFHYEDMSVAEVAGALKTSAKAAEGLLTRARAGLRKKLERHEGDLR